MSRAGCCCDGGGPNPGNCCSGTYESGRKYSLTVETGPWPGFGLSSSVKYEWASTSITCNIFGQPCDAYDQLCVASVSNEAVWTWGGGNGILAYEPTLAPEVPVCAACGPNNFAFLSPASVLTYASVPGGGVFGELNFTWTYQQGWPQATWLSGSLDVWGLPAVRVRFGTNSGPIQTEVACDNDALCNGNGFGLLVTAILPKFIEVPCDPQGIAGRDFDAGGTALYWGCHDSDNRYIGENRYQSRIFEINRVDDCDAVSTGTYAGDSTSFVFGTNTINYVQLWRPGNQGSVPCAYDPTYPFQTYNIPACPASSYVQQGAAYIPPQCPDKAGWWPPLDVPHPFPPTIKVNRLPPAPPTITSNSPSSGPAAGGTAVSIRGTNFIQVTHVRFGSVRVPVLIYNNATEIYCAAPPGTAGTTVSITVVTDGGSATRANAFTYT